MSKSRQRNRPLRQTAGVPPTQEGSWFVVVCSPDHSSRTQELQPGRLYTMGRDASSDIVLDYPWISTRHATIRSGEPPEIVDLGSRNGTRIGTESLQPGRPYAVQPGSVVTLGKVAILIHRGDERDSNVWPRAAPVARLGEEQPAPSRSRRALAAAESLSVVMSQSSKLRAVYAFAKQVANSAVRVLILGETGAGKELLARAVHEHSPRQSNRLVTLNCAAIPENLFESELFGYERGAFSGALSTKPGLFEVAHGSTLFLDEVAELPLTVQAKLLRVLETGEVLRLGSVRPVYVDVRVVSATNRDLRAEIAAGRFRADLFYRLNGIALLLPPLRERMEDIEALARFFAGSACGEAAEPIFTPDALAALRAYAWPGNVRELRSMIERAVLLAQSGPIEAAHLSFEPAPFAALDSDTLTFDSGSYAVARPSMLAGADADTGAVLAELSRRERCQIEDALERTGGNQKEAAKLLGVSRRTLIRRMERHRLTRPRKRSDSSPPSA